MPDFGLFLVALLFVSVSVWVAWNSVYGGEAAMQAASRRAAIPPAVAAPEFEPDTIELAAQIVELAGEIQEHEHDVDVARRVHEPCAGQISGLEARVRDLNDQLHAREARIDELEQRLLAMVEERGDNLQLIRGIGPRLEGQLHELGITRFEQIAAWGERELEQVCSALPSFRSRIVRDHWMEQAAQLCASTAR